MRSIQLSYGRALKTGKLTLSRLGLHHRGRMPGSGVHHGPTCFGARRDVRTGAEWSARNKPSSVPLRGRIIPLGPSSPTASSSLPGTQTARAAPRPLFGLAPDGVCRATSVTSGPVRSYRTLSPLPVPLARPSAVCFLWHFPSSLDARVLPGTLPFGARTFLQQPKLPAILTRHAPPDRTPPRTGRIPARRTTPAAAGPRSGADPA
jgi:hypothetical protein